MNTIKPPKHGEHFELDFSKPEMLDKISRLMSGAEGVMLYLSLITLAVKKKKITLGCLQCWKDNALLLKDCGSLMEEMLND